MVAPGTAVVAAAATRRPREPQEEPEEGQGVEEGEGSAKVRFSFESLMETKVDPEFDQRGVQALRSGALNFDEKFYVLRNLHKNGGGGRWSAIGGGV